MVYVAVCDNRSCASGTGGVKPSGSSLLLLLKRPYSISLTLAVFETTFFAWQSVITLSVLSAVVHLKRARKFEISLETLFL